MFQAAVKPSVVDVDDFSQALCTPAIVRKIPFLDGTPA